MTRARTVLHLALILAVGAVAAGPAAATDGTPDPSFGAGGGTALDWNHGGGTTTYRIVVDVGISKNLVISVQKNSDLMHASWGFDDTEESVRFVRDIDVPQELVNAAIDFAQAQVELTAWTNRVKELV